MIKGNYINVSAGKKTTLYCLIQSITSDYDLNIFFFLVGKEEKLIWNFLELFIRQIYKLLSSPVYSFIESTSCSVLNINFMIVKLHFAWILALLLTATKATVLKKKC